MSDVTVSEDSSPEVVQKTTYTIELKFKAGTIEVDSTSLSDEACAYIFQKGLEAIINTVGMSKITGHTKASPEEKVKIEAAVVTQAKKNLADLKAGSLKGKKASGADKVTGALQTEAMRLAKEMVKDHIRSIGHKQNAYKASEITAYAKEVLAGNPRLLKQAQANLDERAADAKTSIPLNLKDLFKAKEESGADVKSKPKGGRKAKADGEGAPLSAKQSGKVASRAKPKTEAVSHGHTAH